MQINKSFKSTVFARTANFFSENYKFILLLILICFAVYFNGLSGQFMVVDDLHGFVQNNNIQNLGASLESLHLQNMIYALSYHFFGINPLPLKIVALLFHTANAILVFALFYLLFGKQIAIISSFLFSVHPVNSEAINWISANPYLFNAFFFLLAAIFYVLYKKSELKNYFIISLILYTIDVVLIRSVWLLIAPMALVFIDQFLLEKKFNFYNLQKIILYLIPFVLIFGVTVYKGFQERVSYRNNQSGRTLVNQQSLTPIIEGYPYSLYEMSRLYVFPKDLTIYYDGVKVDITLKILMFSSFFIYLGLVYYFYRKNRKMAGLLILLPVLVAPVFTPTKITWLMEERYLYIGTAFFSVILAFLILELQKKIKIKNLSIFLIVFLISLYSVRTFIRNGDWHNPKTLALATMITSPYSVRPYNDLAGTYYQEGNIAKAEEYYKKALQLFPSATAAHNFGLIYLNKGLDKTSKYDFENKQSLEKLLSQAKNAFDQENYQISLFYANEILAIDDKNEQAYFLAGNIFSKAGEFDFARQYLLEAAKINPENENTWLGLGYVAFKQENFADARNYLLKVLEINPQNKEAQENLKMIENLSKKDSP